MQDSKPILLLEDDRIDAMTVQRAFKDLGITNPLVHLVDGEKALDYLKNAANQTPCFILLDLNMPKMNGIEFLTAVNDNEILKLIPVVVLTTSSVWKDVAKSYELGVAGYMVKPTDYKKFAEIIKMITEYWTLSRLPAGE